MAPKSGVIGLTDAPLIAVTGADGFIGKRLCACLVQKGYRVRALSRVLNEKEKEYFDNLGAEVIEGDIRDSGVGERLFSRADGAFNLAGIVGRVGRPDSDYWEVNVTALQRLLKSAAKTGVRRFVSCSTADLAGNVLTPPSDEESACATDDIYQITKAHGEYAALFADRKDGMEVTVVRPTVVYGPGDRRRIKIFKEVMTGRFRLIGAGENHIHPVYVDDLAEGMILAYQSGKSPGNVYIIGGKTSVPVKEWITIIGKAAGVNLLLSHFPALPMRIVAFISEKLFTLVGRQPPLFQRNIEFFLKNRSYSTKKAERDLGFHPSVSLEEGARRTLEWYKKDVLL